MGVLNRDGLLALCKLATETVALEGGGSVILSSMTGADRDAFEQSLFVEDEAGGTRRYNSANIRARLLVRCIVDETGKRMFGDDEADALGRVDAAVLDQLYDVAQRLCRFRKKDLEQAAKN